MTIRRTVLIAAAAACSLLAANRTIAQAPPATLDADQRLKVLEEKMDKVLKLLEGRAPAPPTPEMLAKQTALLQAARDEFATKFEDAQQKFMAFRMKRPVPFGYGVAMDIAKQRLMKDEATLQDLRQRQAEVNVRMALVKNVGDVEKEARALLVLLQRRGVDVDLLRRTPETRGDDKTSVGLAHLYDASLKLETEEIEKLIEATTERIDMDRKSAAELTKYEVAEESLRATRDQSQKLLDTIIAQLNRMDLMRRQQPSK